MSRTRIQKSPARGAVRALALLALGLTLLAPPGGAAEIEGVRFADSARIGEASVPLRGVGLLRYRILIKAYVAAFYADGPAPLDDPLECAPRRLEIEYFWPLSAEQFATATREGMAANLSARDLAALEPRIRQLNALYEDIEPGDRYALTFANERTELAKNGRSLGSIEGADFGRALFGIWLGESPLSPSLKTQLLADRP